MKIYSLFVLQVFISLGFLLFQEGGNVMEFKIDFDTTQKGVVIKVGIAYQGIGFNLSLFRDENNKIRIAADAKKAICKTEY